MSNATFDGANTTLAYRLRVPQTGALAAETVEPPETLTLTYRCPPPRPPPPSAPAGPRLTATFRRSKYGGTLFHAESETGEAWFSVGLFKEQVAVQWRVAPAALPELHRCTARRAHTHWTTFRLAVARDAVRGFFVEADGREEPGFAAAIDVRAWQRLMLHGRVQLGGLRPAGARPAATTTTAAPRTAVRRPSSPAPRSPSALTHPRLSRCSRPTGPPTRPSGSTRRATTSRRTTSPGNTLRYVVLRERRPFRSSATRPNSSRWKTRFR